MHVDFASNESFPMDKCNKVSERVHVVTRHPTQCSMRFFDRKPDIANEALKRVCVLK